MQTKVPVGVTSAAGYSTSLILFVLAIYSFAFNHDRTDQTLGTLAAGVAAALTFLSTQVGRYLQAKELAKKAPVVVAPGVHSNPLVEAEVSHTDADGATQKVGPDEDLDPEPPEGPNPAAAREVLDRTGR